MKKWVVYLLGILTGVILSVALSFVLAITGDDVYDSEELSNNDRIIFEKPGDIIDIQEFKVFQVVEKNAALVTENTDYDSNFGSIYMLNNDDGKYYYDDEIIKIPEGKVVRQLGIYRYPTQNKMIKTVPIIAIMEK
jgi:hypothetical protein